MHTSGWKAGGAGNTQSDKSKLSWMSFLAFDFARATNESLYFAAHVFLYVQLGFGIITNLITLFFLRWGLNSGQRIKIGHWLNRPFPCAVLLGHLFLSFSLSMALNTPSRYFLYACASLFALLYDSFPFVSAPWLVLGPNAARLPSSTLLLSSCLIFSAYFSI